LIMMENQRKVFIFDNTYEIANVMVRQWKELSLKAIREKGFFVAALSGGRTPRDFYRNLSLEKGISTWDKNHLFLVDERLVPFTDADSNYGMLNDLLLRKVNIPPENCHFIPVHGASPETDARKYEENIRKFFRLQKNKLPVFDLIVLGIGKDGHTASLFPGTEALIDKKKLAVPVILDQARHDRITLTLPVINRATNIIFLAHGRKKAIIIKKVIEGRDVLLPASLVKPVRGRLIFLLDRDASSLLSGKFQNNKSAGKRVKFNEHNVGIMKEDTTGINHEFDNVFASMDNIN
jgi:6-phosphogluconolactonase